ncbi:hypothetical protein LR48_Vigan09g047000 [Vigna angularis]|uniref:Transposase (putative) gypsy type domain-containing protein n=1 Tax=Phaseolus angularis TaxID=3914 RepID=A0A0L9V9Q3_PHAAN|nr:hypothetical protein LR48_Vigan09g047000 [Vigna angularis]
MEGSGHNAGVRMPEQSSVGERPEITTVPCGEAAFVYGNVVGEGPGVRLMSPISGDEYHWAASEVRGLMSQFRSRAVLENWIENSCILRTLGYQTCVKLIACREDERVCHGRENSPDEFFYCYASPFYDLYMRLPFTVFQMEVLRTLNVAPSQLHPNSWGYMQAFAVLCRAVGIRPTVGLFLHFFRCRPVEKKGWVSLISEPGNALLELYLQSYRGFKDKFFKVSITPAGQRHFFCGDGNPKFPLYWTQDPLRFTSWPEDKMTIEELEALSVLTSLPRPFSSRELINCLEFDDADARVFEIMGRKGRGINWFQSIGGERKVDATCPESSSGRAADPQRTQAHQAAPVVVSLSTDEATKRKLKTIGTSGVASKKQKEVADEPKRPIPLGVWDSSFTLGHKVELNLDSSEKTIVENMSEQQIADAMLEMSTRVQMLAWHMAYASDRGQLRVELEKLRAQHKEVVKTHAACESRQRQSEQLMREAEVLLREARAAGQTFKKERDQMSSELVAANKAKIELEQAKKEMATLIKERDGWRAESLESKDLVEDLKDAVMLEHTRGFRKALRQVGHLLNVSTDGVEFDVQKDVYEGELRPLSEIPGDAFMGEEEVEEVAAAEGPSAETVSNAAGHTENIVID